MINQFEWNSLKSIDDMDSDDSFSSSENPDDGDLELEGGNGEIILDD